MAIGKEAGFKPHVELEACAESATVTCTMWDLVLTGLDSRHGVGSIRTSLMGSDKSTTVYDR